MNSTNLGSLQPRTDRKRYRHLHHLRLKQLGLEKSASERDGKQKKSGSNTKYVKRKWSKCSQSKHPCFELHVTFWFRQSCNSSCLHKIMYIFWLRINMANVDVRPRFVLNVDAKTLKTAPSLRQTSKQRKSTIEQNTKNTWMLTSSSGIAQRNKDGIHIK